MASVPQPIQEVIFDYLQKVGEQIKINKVILFGSYAKGLFSSDSDIDLAVFSDDFIGMEPIERFRFLFMQAADYGLDLQPLAFTTSDLTEPDGIVEEILSTGQEIIITK
jgi:Predicted nucleotidyltransferases